MNKSSFRLSNSNFDWLKLVSNGIIYLLIIVLLGVLSFIIYRSVPVLKEAGLGFILDSDWTPKNNSFGIWNFIVSTFWTIFITMFLVVILNLFTSIFISKFLPIKVKKVVLFFTQFFAGIPSIAFGVFGAFVFVDLFQKMGVIQPQSMLMAILVLVIMILPTTVALTVNILDNVPYQYELSAYALGIDRVTVAFKIVKKFCSKAILVVLFFGFCKAIGEVTAISLIAGNGPDKPPLDHGFASFFFGSITTLSSLIGLEIAENFGDLHESALFAVSGVLLFLVFFVNLLLTFYLHLRLPKIKGKKVDLWTVIVPTRVIVSGWFSKLERFWFSLVYWSRTFLMFFAFFLVGSILIWVLVDISWKGMANFNFAYLGTTGGDQGLLSVLLATVILVLTSLLFAIPVSFFAAIFLVYYSQQNWFLKKINKFLTFFIYQFSSAPTIIFGMFGLAVFVSFFGLGFSILSAALTMTLVVLPIIVQTIRQNLESFPVVQYQSAIALGLKKHKIILKLILPATLTGLWVALILAVNRIIAESSPIFITMGTTVLFPKRGVFSGGRTLSSHMYLVSMESMVEDANAIVYQTAFLALLVLFLLNLFIYFFQQRQQLRKSL